jgi:hypothetical protein
MKAQVVVNDRALCVAYDQELRSLLQKRAADGHTLDGTAVVMSVQSKDVWRLRRQCQNSSRGWLEDQQDDRMP